MKSFHIGRLNITIYKDWAKPEIVHPLYYIHPYETYIHFGFLTVGWEWDMNAKKHRLAGFDSVFHVGKIHVYRFRNPTFGLTGPFWFYGNHYRMINISRIGILVPEKWTRRVETWLKSLRSG